jgi:putative ABC transport system substrate-binding protein
MRLKLLCIALASILLTGLTLNCHAAGTVIAAMMSSDQPRYHEAHRSFIKSLTARGYSPATTEIILQTPNPDQLSWSNTVRKFNAYKPAVILTYGAPAAMTAMKESDGIPVVTADFYASAQPSKGMCGVSSRIPMITLLKALQEIKPFRRVGILYSSREIGSQRQAEDIRKTAIQLGVTVVDGNFTSTAALDSGLNALMDKVDVIITTESSVVCRNFSRIIERTKGHNTPVASVVPDSAEKGALVSLEISPQEQGHLAAEIVVRILEGATPDHLSLLMPRRIELILNMRVARDLGLNPPFSVLGNATRIIK